MSSEAKNLSYYTKNKYTPTYTLYTLATIIEVLRGTGVYPSDGKAAIILESGLSTYSFIVNDEAEALYLKRKLTKVARLAFKDEINITVETRG